MLRYKQLKPLKICYLIFKETLFEPQVGVLFLHTWITENQPTSPSPHFLDTWLTVVLINIIHSLFHLNILPTETVFYEMLQKYTTFQQQNILYFLLL